MSAKKPSLMNAAKYDRPAHGKLTTNLSLPVDHDFKERVERIKAKKDFNAWARDQLYSRLWELEEDEKRTG